MDMKARVGINFYATHRAGGQSQQNPIRFKNMLREAADRLVGIRYAPVRGKRTA
jgi:hypothetical protein